MRQLKTIKAKDALPGLDNRLPQYMSTPKSFFPTDFPYKIVSIGNEMPYLVKMFVNTMKNSSLRTVKRNMVFRAD